jgi:hypothetical protein
VSFRQACVAKTHDLLREFTPDMKRLFRKHAPKKILRMEEKLPIPAEDKP